MQDRLKIAVFTEFPFPLGLSGTNRLISYSKGLVELGCFVKVFIGQPTEEIGNIRNKRYYGIYQGIEYSYPFKRTTKSKVKIIKGIDLLFGLIKTLFNIYINNFDIKFDALIIANDNPILVFIVSTYAQMIGIKKRLMFVDEYPEEIRKGGDKVSFINNLFFKLSFTHLSGIVSMTNLLKDYYVQRYKIRSSLILPMTVEGHRFQNIKKSIKLEFEYIAYIGNLDIAKDGVDILIRAFSIVSYRYPRLKLLLCGASKKKYEKDYLRTLVKKLELEGRVIFYGQVDRNDVPEILCSAKALLLARPNSKRAEGGFPTKLGEYLATGKPVVVTRVGEIPNYLIDNYNAFIAEPDDEYSFAEKILSILDMPKNAQKVGERGRQLALDTFDYKVQSKRLLSYLVKL